jgi:Tol biopolymer transport system component
VPGALRENRGAKMRVRLGRRTWLVTLLAVVLASLTALPATAKYAGTNGQIAFTHYDDIGSHVFIANPDGGNPTQLPADDADGAVWSPDGSQILLTICCPGVPPRPAIVNADGTGFHLLSVPGLPADGAVACRAWSPDASQLLCQFMGDTDHSRDGIYTIAASDGAVLKRLTVNPYPPTGNFGGGDIPGDYSPDGSQFVFMRAKPGAGPVPNRNQSGALFVENADGTGLHQITPYGLANSHDNATESWSPDGEEILFAGVHGPFAGAGLYVVHTDGTGLRAIPLQLGSRSFAFTPRWSPDGSKIIFSLFTTTGPGTGDEGIATANADGSGLSQVTSGGGYDFADWGTHPLTG